MQGIMFPKAANRERRKKSRKSPLSLVYVELSAANGGMMRDLSEEGFALRAMVPLRAGEKTPFSFSLNESVRIEGEGEIQWIEENGRVAGVRFIEISPSAREQILSWVSGTSETPKLKEVPETSAPPGAQSFDQLREELRSSPSRKEVPELIQAENLPPPPEAIPPAPQAIPDAPPQEKAPVSLNAATLVEKLEAQETEPPSDPASFPGLPSFASNQDAIE